MAWNRRVLLAAVLALVAAPGQAKDMAYRVRTDCPAAAVRCFVTVQAALDASAADAGPGWARIAIGPGIFREKIVVRRHRTRLSGAGTTLTRLVFDAVARDAGRYDRAGWGTAGSATVTIAATDVQVRDLTIENDFDFLANRALAKDDPRRIVDSQAVAVQLDMDSDRVAFDRVALLGYHDTFLARGRRAVFRRGLIAGTIDFIFGPGMLLIEDSEIRSRPGSEAGPTGGFVAYVTAPSTPVDQPVGIVAYRSWLTREPGVADGSVALGRPWHPTTTFADGRYADPRAVGMAMFVDCFMDAHIHPDHWTSMAGTARDGTKSRIFTPRESRFSEAGSHGPGARRRDIGIDATPRPTTAEVRRTMFAGWKD